MLASVLTQFGLHEDQCTVKTFGSGLINNTWKVINGENNYILQRINHFVFKQPANIAHNIRYIADYFKQHSPGYLFVSPVPTIANTDLVGNDIDGYFRMFPFVPGSHTVDTVHTPEEAYEAAKQFGRFTRLLSGADINQLKITLPDFHNLSLRYQQFQRSINEGDKARIASCSNEIEFLQNQQGIVETFEDIRRNAHFKLRVTHHDTKISNILFDDSNKGICVIDLDTVMPGYFISDVGDMMRTYLSPVSEEEADFSKIEVRNNFFKAIVDGYMAEMADELSPVEKQYFVYAAKFLVYMQALRFITDYFNNDVYYGAKYPEHNIVRAKNQVVLLQRILEKEEVLSRL